MITLRNQTNIKIQVTSALRFIETVKVIDITVCRNRKAFAFFYCLRLLQTVDKKNVLRFV